MKHTIKSNQSNPSIKISTFYEVFLGFEEEVEDIVFESSATRCKFSDDLRLLADVACEILFIYKGQQIAVQYNEKDVEVDFDNFIDADRTRFEVFDVTADQFGQSEHSEMVKREVIKGLEIQIGFDRIN